MWSLRLLAAAAPALAAVHTYNWDVTWVNSAPNGFARPVVGINGQWPNPTIRGSVGDTVVVNVFNALGNQTTSLHWHGMYMTDTPHMDGATGVSQCPILPGQNFTYEFKLEQGGTYWWHSHDGGQYADGLRGALIVDDPADPNLGTYDEEYLLSVSDWYDSQVPALLAQLLSPNNTQFRPPIANSALINEAATSSFTIKPGHRYRFRVINYSALANAIVQFGGHTMRVIETDGIPVVPADADRIALGAGMRYSVVVEAKNSTAQDYPVLVMLDMNPNYNAPVLGFPANATGLLKYAAANAEPAPLVIDQPITFLDDMTLSPSDLEPAHDYTVQVTKNFTFGLDSEGIPRAFINGDMYVNQKVPTLYTALTVGSAATNPVVYGAINPTITDRNAVVQVVLNNFTPAGHPFHLHGHHFQVLARGAFNAGAFNGSLTNVPAAPLYRDTVMVEGNSFVVLRYLAARPGAWIFHCHMEWHVHMGATSTFITAPVEAQSLFVVPQSQTAICPCGDARGNAAGNTADVLDMAGANTKPPLPDNGAMYNADTEAACINNATSSSSIPLSTATSIPLSTGPVSTASSVPTSSVPSSVPTSVSSVPTSTVSPVPTSASTASSISVSPSLSVPTSLPASVTRRPTSRPGSITRRPTSRPGSVTRRPTSRPGSVTRRPTSLPASVTKVPVSSTKKRCRARYTPVTTW